MRSTLFLQEVYWKILGLAVLVLVPILIGFIWTQDILFLNLGIISASLFIGMIRLNLDIPAIMLHFILIWLGFTALFFSFQIPYLFILVCASMAFGTIYFTKHGTNLRGLANFIFIPAVYLACEMHENLSSSLMVASYLKFISLWPISLITLCAMSFGMHLLSSAPSAHNLSARTSIFQINLHNVQLGVPETHWEKPAIAIFLAVMLSATIVMMMDIPKGEWVIWSTAAVITMDVVSSRKKAKERLIGLSIGIPLGFIVGQFVPKNEIIYSLAVLAIMLTLVAFKRYQVGFASRCFFITLASYIATATPQIALERVENVIIGGIIGLVMLHIVHIKIK